METIRIVIDADLLREIDRAARRAGVSRWEFIAMQFVNISSDCLSRSPKSQPAKSVDSREQVSRGVSTRHAGVRAPH